MSAFTVEISNLPERCPYCGHEPQHRAWPLGYHATEIIIVCPQCHSRIGRLVAVPPTEEE